MDTGKSGPAGVKWAACKLELQHMDISALANMDFVVINDGSGSMDKADCKGNRTRWKAQQESTVQFARDVEKIDSDGIDLILMNRGEIEQFPGSTSDKLESLLSSRSPRGGTPTAEALQAAFALKKPGRKLFVLVNTDGVPDDKAAVEAVITKQANSQATDDECTVLFVQVGQDADAREWLQKLDDNLNTKFDIVDTKTADEADKFASTTELIIAAING